MQQYAFMTERLFDTPLLIAEHKLRAIQQALAPRMGFVAPDIKASEMSAEADAGKYKTAMGGQVAIIPVIGTLVHRSGYMDAMSGLVSYESILAQHEAALADPAVTDIVHVYATGGGEVAGAFEAADRLYESRGDKPIIAVIDEHAFSAGCLLASAADKILVPRTGGTGSIGVITSHIDYSGMLEKEGIVVNHMYAGKKKADGSPYRPLSDRARDDRQAEIESVYDLFTETYARNRGMKVQAVRDTEAGMFFGKLAVAKGLADEVKAYRQVMTDFSTRSNQRRLSMSVDNQGAASTSQDNNGAAQAETQAGVDTINTGEQVSASADGAGVTTLAAARTEGANAAVLAAKERATAISDMCTLAGMSSKAGEMIASDLSVDQVRGRLVEAKAVSDDGAAIAAHIPLVTENKASAINTKDIYADYNQGK